TSSVHGEDGYIIRDPKMISARLTRLDRKLRARVDDFSYHRSESVDGAETLVITYGVSGRAVRRACRELRIAGRKVGSAILMTLWPVPEELIRRVARDVSRVLVVEANFGQYVFEIERVLKNRKVDFLGKMDGALITPSMVRDAVLDY
ncbi:MAG: pyruvate flavodoxin/ferredoxin oxidoreductase, partial [Pseudomonadota bacterium]